MLGYVIKTKNKDAHAKIRHRQYSSFTSSKKRDAQHLMVLRILFYELIITIRYLSWSINYC